MGMYSTITGMTAILALGTGIAAAAGTVQETFENDWFKISVNPLGGRLSGIYSKAASVELVDTDREGTFSEFSWDRWKSRPALAQAPYAVRGRANDGTISVATRGSALNGQLPFLQVSKRYVSTPDSSALRVEYRFINVPDAMSVQAYSPAILVAVGMKGETMRYFYPLEDGGIASPLQRGCGNHFTHTSPPARGWFATASPDGVGAAVTLPFSEIKSFYTWFKDVDVPSTEVKFSSVGIENGKSYDFVVELIPFRGLKTVSGAGGGYVGELADGVCRVVCSRAGRVTAKADGLRKELSFTKPAQMLEFRTDATSVSLDAGGKEVCRLDAKPRKGPWRLSPTGPRRPEFFTKVDLTCFTNFCVRACTPWARPLHGGKVKVSAVSGLGNLTELGELAARFDMDIRMIGVVGNTDMDNRAVNDPLCTYGEYFGRLKPEDLEREVQKVLSWKSDVILLGGAPLDMLSATARRIIAERVKAGTGLLLVGQDRDAPDFGLRLRSPSAVNGVPKPVGGSLASVPFGLLGDEKVYDFDAKDARVMAVCAGRAYAAEYRLGAGKLINLPYCAALRKTYIQCGITPNLRDIYPDRAPPVEHYYSLIAKAIMMAAGRRPTVEAGGATFSEKTAAISCDSSEEGRFAVTWRVMNAFRDTLAEGTAEASLRRGSGRVEIPLSSVPEFAGPLTLECSFLKGGASCGWGAWEFRREPAAAISSLETDEGHYEEGQVATLLAKVVGATEGLDTRIRLSDNFGRVMAEVVRPASAALSASFKLENALPMRSCTATAELLRDGSVVSRRQKWFLVRPSGEKTAWNDFELAVFGSIDVRPHLWPYLAKAYDDFGISTVTGSWGLYDAFCPRYGFNGDVGTFAGLLMENEPAQFAKTGDKTLLARRNCVSDPKFFERLRRTLNTQRSELLRKLRLRWHSFGDEQSLTGYEGRAIDFCFSEHCLREFRKFARERYGTLKRLNEEYESSFATWDEVMPFTRQEVWKENGRHVAGWSDHLEFMDSRATNALAFGAAIIRRDDPCIRLTLSGTQPPAAYSGMDWWKIMHVLDCTLGYRIGGQLDIHRSFRPDGRFMPCEWGYGCCGGIMRKRLWDILFHGCHGVIGFWSRSMYRPDLTPTPGMSDVAGDLDRLVHGVGKHVIANLRPRAEVAMLYSQASFRAAFIEERRAEHDDLLERCRQALRSLGCAFDYVSYEELERGEAARRAYKALLLVEARAMSDGEVDAVKDFSARGGGVVAISMPAVRKANCRLREKPPFEGFFDGRHKMLLEPAAEDAALRASLKASLLAVGVPADELTIARDNGARADDARVFSMRDGAGNPFWGIVTESFDGRCVKVKFPKKGWIFDLVDGRAYGQTDCVQVAHGRGSPHAFALLPEPSGIASLRVDGNRVMVDCGAKADTVVRLRVFRPDGTEARCYAANITAKSGRAEHTVPFAMSDAPGEWNVSAENVMDASSRREARIRR